MKRRGPRTRGPFPFSGISKPHSVCGDLFASTCSAEAHKHVNPDGPTQPLQWRQQNQEGRDARKEKGLRLFEKSSEMNPTQLSEGHEGDQDCDPQADSQPITHVCGSKIKPGLSQEIRLAFQAGWNRLIDRAQPIRIANSKKPPLTASGTSIPENTRK